MRELVVWGGTYDGRNRMIVATRTKKAAYEAFNAVANVGSYSLWNQYTSDSGNETEITVTTAEPGTVFTSSCGDHEYKKVTK